MRAQLTDMGIEKRRIEAAIKGLEEEGGAAGLNEGTNNFGILYQNTLREQEKRAKKIYGTKAAQKLSADFKREVTDVTINQHKKILKAYREAVKLLEKSQTELQKCISDLAIRLPEAEKALVLKKSDIDQKVDLMQKQLTAVIDASKEI